MSTPAVAAYASVCLALAAAAFVAGIRNVAEFRRLRQVPPLDEAEILRAPVPPARAPSRWPRPESINDARVAAAYRDLAHERREYVHILGGFLGFVGGAALGVTIGHVSEGGSQMWAAVGWTLVGMCGLMLRLAADVHGTSLGTRYERRRAELSKPPRKAARAASPARSR